nr:cytochrome C oxidase subunit IV family protein [Saprospiraceae bacterium]
MGHTSYEEAKRTVFRGLILLGLITVAEVFIALLGKGYVISGFYLPIWLVYLAMIGLSLYKAFFIMGEFMHLKYEVRGLVSSILLPFLLLVWAIIAFLWDGSYWHNQREDYKTEYEKEREGHIIDEADLEDQIKMLD